MTRKMYKSPKVLQKEYHKVAEDITRLEQKLIEAGILEQSSENEEDQSDQSEETNSVIKMPNPELEANEEYQYLLKMKARLHEIA